MRAPSGDASTTHGAERLEALTEPLRARNRQQAAVAALSRAAIGAEDLTELLGDAVERATRTLNMEFGFIAELVTDGAQFRVRSSLGWQESIVGLTEPVAGSPVEDLLRSGAPLVMPDLSTRSPLRLAGRVEDGQRIRSCLGVVIPGRQRPWGAIVLHSTGARSFTPDDVEFLTSVANVLALLIARDALAEERRRETEMAQAIFDNIPIMISICDASGRVVRVNREWENTLGWTLAEAQQRDVFRDAYPDPGDYAEVIEFCRRSDRRWTDFRARTRDGRTLDAAWIRFKLSDGSSIGLGVDLTEGKQAEKALAESQGRFARIFQASPVALGMSTIADGRILDVNETWLKVLGYRREEVIGRTNAELAITVDPQTRAAAVRQARETGEVREAEIQLRTKSGERRDVIVTAVPFGGEAGQEAWISAFVDITDRKRAETDRDRHLDRERTARADAEQALDKLRAVYAITDSVVAHAALDDLLHELLGRLRRTLHVDVATALFLSDDRKSLYVRAIDAPNLKELRPVRMPIGKGLSGRIAAHGRPLIITDYATVDLSGVEGASPEEIRAANQAVMGVPLCIGEKVVGVVVVTSMQPRDFTQEELKLLLLVADRVAPAIERGQLLEKIRTGRERQKALARRLLTAQEEERRRLAVELHDELGQVLTAVKINLESLQRAPGDRPLPAALDGMIGSVDDALQRVRDIALDLRPSVLDDLGLPAALRWYADRIARDARVEAHLSIDALPDLEAGLATACFRVAQEALTNVARHAHARHVWLDLHLLPDGLELRVRDDGIGFDVSAARERAIAGASVGLLGMQERVSLVGGEYEIANGAAGGVEVRASFPIGEKAAAL